MNRMRSIPIIVLTSLMFFCLAADLNPDEEWAKILRWQEPKNYPPPTLEGMDMKTLAKLTDAGNVQWYMPRPEPEKWETVVGMKVHAPPEKVWEVLTDYPALCKIMPLTYLACETEYRDGNTVKNNQKGQTTIIRFAYKYDIIDIVHEDPPYHHHVNTISGLEKRELDVILVPWKDNAETMMFMRYYLNMAALGVTMQAMMAIAPMTEPPTAAGAANYHSRAYKNEAEKRVGYKPLKEPRPMDFTNLDMNTLRLISKRGGGLLRETPEGKILEVMTWTFIKAPQERVWEVITDFDHYGDIYKGSTMTVVSREGNQVTALQAGPSMSILIFEFSGFELPARYTLEPPSRMSYYAYEGLYEGSRGSYNIVPVPGSRESVLFHQAGFNLERDQSLTARIFKSGAFPLENMLYMLGAQSSVAHVREEAERREAAGK